jgi:hypothetical protein
MYWQFKNWTALSAIAAKAAYGFPVLRIQYETRRRLRQTTKRKRMRKRKMRIWKTPSLERKKSVPCRSQQRAARR